MRLVNMPQKRAVGSLLLPPMSCTVLVETLTMSSKQASGRRIAVIGSGSGGLAVARRLQSRRLADKSSSRQGISQVVERTLRLVLELASRQATPRSKLSR
jgi:hypothetical protein